MSRVARDAPQVEAFVKEMERFDQEGRWSASTRGDTLCTTPLLLNLLVSEYLRHEAKGSAIQFNGASNARASAARSWCRGLFEDCTA